MEHKDDILIDRFLRGELTENEKKGFQRMLEEEEGFSLKVKHMEELNAGVKESVLQEKRGYLEGLEAEIMSKEEPLQEPNGSAERKVKKGSVVKVRRYTIAAMIVIIIGFIGIKWYYGQENAFDPLLESHFEEYVIHEVNRSTESKYSKKQLQAYNNYALKDFEFAIPLLKELWEVERDTLALYYLGISHLMLKEEKKGKIILGKTELKNYEKPENN